MEILTKGNPYYWLKLFLNPSTRWPCETSKHCKFLKQESWKARYPNAKACQSTNGNFYIASSSTPMEGDYTWAFFFVFSFLFISSAIFSSKDEYIAGIIYVIHHQCLWHIYEHWYSSLLLTPLLKPQHFFQRSSMFQILQLPLFF